MQYTKIHTPPTQIYNAICGTRYSRTRDRYVCKAMVKMKQLDARSPFDMKRPCAQQAGESTKIPSLATHTALRKKAMAWWKSANRRLWKSTTNWFGGGNCSFSLVAPDSRTRSCLGTDPKLPCSSNSSRPREAGLKALSRPPWDDLACTSVLFFLIQYRINFKVRCVNSNEDEIKESEESTTTAFRP